MTLGMWLRQSEELLKMRKAGNSLGLKGGRRWSISLLMTVVKIEAKVLNKPDGWEMTIAKRMVHTDICNDTGIHFFFFFLLVIGKQIMV